MNSGPIAVLHFCNSLVRGGTEEHILTLLRGLDRNYFRPYLVCPAEVAEKLRTDLPADVELVPLHLRKPAQLGSAVRLARILRRVQVGILHSHGFYSSLFATPIGYSCRVPVILETPHVREQWRTGWLKSRYFVDRWIGRFVDYYIAVSHANARYLAEEKGLPKEKIAVIYNGCKLDRFDPLRPAPVGLKQSLGFHDSDPVLIVIGRLEPQKGHHVLLNALPAIRSEFPGVRLVCLGEGSLRTDLERQVRTLGLEESVRFVGYQPNVPDWLALADVMVLPSLYEGLSLVAIESLAAGRPVVATAVDGTPEIVVDGKTGFTVPPDDAKSLAEAICRCLRDPGLRQTLARAGRAWVMEWFNQEQQIQRTQELYLSAWQQRTGAKEAETWRPTIEGRSTSDRIPLRAPEKWIPKP